MTNKKRNGKLERMHKRIQDGIPLPDHADEILATIGLDREDLPLDEPAGSEDDDEGALEMPTAESADADLLPAPGGELTSHGAASVPDDQIVAEYMSGYSLPHILRSGTQPAAVRPLLEEMVMPLARQMCREAGVEDVAAMLLAEQAVEARMDEVHYRALAGCEMDRRQISKAQRLMCMADRCSRRIAKAIEQLHRLRKPKVNVKISKASNINFGQQQVVNQPEGGAPTDGAAS